jgi:translation initiation factor IF-2
LNAYWRARAIIEFLDLFAAFGGRRSAGVRLLRDDVVIHEGTLKTLKRFKDEVSEVQSGQECGMAFENYDDIRPNDVIEIFEREEVERTLA